MKVNSINTYTPMSTTLNNTPSFNGRLIVKGKNWNNALLEAIGESEGIRELASGKKDVICRIKLKFASGHDCTHYAGEPIYKLNIKMKNPKPTFKEKIKMLFGKQKSTNVNHHYHSEDSLIYKIKTLDTNYLMHRIKNK